jgi:hypothetical protein
MDFNKLEIATILGTFVVLLGILIVVTVTTLISRGPETVSKGSKTTVGENRGGTRVERICDGTTALYIFGDRITAVPNSSRCGSTQ